MERKIGETFEFEGKKIGVKTASNGCDGCFLKEKCCIDSADLLGTCGAGDRTDGKNVIFVEVQEQPQKQTEQQQGQIEPQKLNLCEILKDCQNGELFWSPLLGDVKLYDIDEEAKTIDVTTKDLATWEINADGTITIDDITSEVIMLYPSRTQIDWTKVKYEKKKERFNPKTLKPFDKVLSKCDGSWSANLFSHIEERANENYSTCFFVCNGSSVKFCIPYNDETKHLIGTTKEAPVFYRYWED